MGNNKLCRFLRYINPNNKAPHIRMTFDILMYFLVTFATIRVFVYSMVYGSMPKLYLYIKGIHVHHLNFGIFILAIICYLSLFTNNNRLRSVLAKIYGIALAFTFDEFGLWLFLRDDYWVRQSYDAVVIIVVIFLNIIYFHKFWRKVFTKGVSGVKVFLGADLNGVSEEYGGVKLAEEN